MNHLQRSYALLQRRKQMPKRNDIKKIMIIGSGPIIIGQAAEFDYAGTQACLALKEEGYEVVLVNSNPATIMTDREIADTVYIEPITLEFVSKILRKERPDALLPTLGGQTGLNMAMELSKTGILEELNVELLGTKLSAIDQQKTVSSLKNYVKELVSHSVPVILQQRLMKQLKLLTKLVILSSSVQHLPWVEQVEEFVIPKKNFVRLWQMD